MTAEPTLLINYALSFAGRAYHWGGNDPIEGFDCSGFVQEILMAFGCLKRTKQKYSAQTLFQITPKSALFLAGMEVPQAHDIVFFGPHDLAISHVGFCAGQHFMIHAASGDSTTTSDAVAAAQNAFVRIDRIDYRSDILLFIRPRYFDMQNG